MEIGYKFNRWTVLSESFISSDKRTLLITCQCDCGVVKDLSLQSVLSPSKRSISCGCFQRENASSANKFPTAGEKFGRLTVLKVLETNKRSAGGDGKCYVSVICDCGNLIEKSRFDSIKIGKVQSCGCLKKEVASLAKSHGMTRTPTYSSWGSMKQRCDNPNSTFYYLYGGKGISYTPRWESFENFLEDMGERPLGLSLDRIDSKLNYYKENCRWATPSVQAHNQEKEEGTSSKYVGVSFTKKNKKFPWKARLNKNLVRVLEQSFETEEEAAKAYDKYCLIHYGIVKNFPLEKQDHMDDHNKDI